MTPCEKLGYKVGDEFEFTGDRHHGYLRGETVTLTEDDGTTAPWFKCGTREHCVYLHDIKPLRITLRSGDYVATKGMTEDEYHAVARAFVEAGAEEGEYPNIQYFLPNDRKWCFGIDDDFKNYHGHINYGCFAGGRQLTISQILNATNSGKTQPEEAKMHLTDRLEQAIKSRDEA